MPEDTKYIVNQSQLTAIGTAIRGKLNEQTTYTVDEMPEKIGDISAGSGYPTVTVTIKNEDDSSANIELYGWDPDANDYILYAIFNDNNIKYFQKGIELDPNETVVVNGELVGLSFMIALSTTATSTGDVVIEFDESWDMYKATVTGNCEITLSTR